MPVDVEQLFVGRDAAILDLVDPPSLLPSASAWWVNGQRAWPVQGELPANAMHPVTRPVVQAGALTPSGAEVAGAREEVVLEYLRLTRELVDAQRASFSGISVSLPAR